MDENNNNENYENNNKEYKETRRRDRRNTRRNDDDGIGVGITLIFIGIVWMLNRLNFIDFSIVSAISKLWPLLLVVAGVNMIFRRRIVKAITWTLFLIALLAYGTMFPYNDFDFDFNFGDNNIIRVNTNYQNEYIEGFKFSETNEVYEDGMLALNIPAGDISIEGMEEKGLKYKVPDFILDNSNTILTSKGGSILASFEPSDKFLDDDWNDGDGYKFSYELGSDTEWDIEINAGAAEANLDLTDANVQRLEINTGAGEINLKIGDLNKTVKVFLNSGVAEVNVQVPEGSGIEFETNGFIEKDDLKRLGFEKYNGKYYSKGFDDATNIIEIEVNSVLAEINVEYY